MTLRKITWMVAERKRVWGELAAWHLSGVVAHIPFSGAVLDPRAINPYKGDEPEDPGLARIKAFIATRAWRAMCRAGRDDRGQQ